MAYEPTNVEVDAKKHAIQMERLLNLECALILAVELGQCYRGDWSDFDGRTLKHQIEELQKVADGSESMDRYRAWNEMCSAGQGHWSDSCKMYECPGAEEDAA
jgi:hypothetical protein